MPCNSCIEYNALDNKRSRSSCVCLKASRPSLHVGTTLSSIKLAAEHTGLIVESPPSTKLTIDNYTDIQTLPKTGCSLH